MANIMTGVGELTRIAVEAEKERDAALARAEAAEAKLAAAIETAASAAMLCGEWEDKARRWAAQRDAALARAERAEAALDKANEETRAIRQYLAEIRP